MSNPSASSRSETDYGTVELAKEEKGTLETRSRKKEPLRYFFPIMCGSLTSMLCLVSRKLVLKRIMMSKRKNKSTKASVIVITFPLRAECPLSL